MIVSHKHRFIFLKTRKTAGTSIEIALSKHCGPDDIITVISEADEGLRQEFGGTPPQNYTSPPLSEPAWNHMFAARVKRIVGPTVWESYFTFAVERNPWDVVLSSHSFEAVKSDSPTTLHELVSDDFRLQKLARNQLIYRLDDEIAVNKVCRYEDLTAELEEVWDRIGLPGPVDLPTAKRRPETARKSRRDAFTPEDAEVVRLAFAKTVRDFGYDL